MYKPIVLSTFWVGDELCMGLGNLNIDQRAYDWVMFSNISLERHKHARPSQQGDERSVFDEAQKLLKLKFAHFSAATVKHDTPR